jgi:cell division protein FtsA
MSASKGIRRGVVVDLEETVTAISHALEQAERQSGVPLEHATLSINGGHISSLNSRGVIAVARADGEISPEDVTRVIEAAQAVSIPSNREIVHVIPKVFTVDGQEGIRDPIGMNGVRLEVETHIITGSSPTIKNLTKCVYQAGMHIDELVLAPLAAARAVLTKRQRELGSVLIDIGNGTTGIVVYEESDLLYTGILPVGSGHITNDIAIGLRTSLDTAESIKLEYGVAQAEAAPQRDKISVKDESGELIEATRKNVAEIIEARLEEIFSMVRADLRKIGRDALLPAGAVLTGGGANLEGIVDYAKEQLRLPVQKGTMPELRGMVDKLDDPSYATSVGLILWAYDTAEEQGFKSTGSPQLGQAMQKAKKWIQNFLP